MREDVTVKKAEDGLYRSNVVETYFPGDDSIYSVGHNDIITEITAQQTPRAKAWIAEFKNSLPFDSTPETIMAPEVQWLAEKSIDFSEKKETMSRPVDIIEITLSGTRWIKKKSNCQE